MADEQRFDVLVLGIGHQGLICANYLAKAGFQVCVLDSPSPEVGATPYNPFHESAMTGPCAHRPVHIPPALVSDLELESHGFSMKDAKPSLFAPQMEGDFFYSSTDSNQRFYAADDANKGDMERFHTLCEELQMLAGLFGQVNTDIPDYTEKGWKDIWALFDTARHLTDDHRDLQGLFARIMTQSLSQFLDETFESDRFKGLLAFQSCFGSMANPDKAGTASLLLGYIMATGERTLFQGDWQPLRGSMHSFFKALTNAGLANGVTFATHAASESLIIEGGTVTGVQTDDGVYKAPIVIGDINPRLLFEDMLPEGQQIAPDFQLKLNAFKNSNGFIRAKLLLQDIPNFTCLEGQKNPAEFLGGEIVLCPDLDFMRKALADTKSQGGSQRPGVSMVLPSMRSDDLSYDGGVPCSLIGQYFEPDLPDNDENKIAAAKAMVATVEAFAPGFRDSVSHFITITGETLEKTAGPLNLDLAGGGQAIAQLMRKRFSHHAIMADIPLGGLYICGYGPESSANPHLIDAGQRLANFIRNTRKPSAATL